MQDLGLANWLFLIRDNGKYSNRARFYMWSLSNRNLMSKVYRIWDRAGHDAIADMEAISPELPVHTKTGHCLSEHSFWGSSEVVG